MATVETIYLGGLRTEATHVQSGTKILTDAPTDNHGKGEAFSPTDLVATALGSCMMTIMGIAAQTHGIDIDGTKLHITKIMSASPRNRRRSAFPKTDRRSETARDSRTGRGYLPGRPVGAPGLQTDRQLPLWRITADRPVRGAGSSGPALSKNIMLCSLLPLHCSP